MARLNKYYHLWADGKGNAYLDEIPSMEEPPRLTGHWEALCQNIYECSNCGKCIMPLSIKHYRYCHWCGSKMEVE